MSTPAFVDPALAQPAGGGSASSVAPAQQAGSPLAQLAADFRRQARKAVIDVPGRDGYTVVFDAVIPYEIYQAWLVAAADPASPTGVNQLELAVRCLTSQCTQIRKDEQLLIVDGEPVTFVTEALQQMLGAIDAAGAVRAFYGTDGLVLKVSGALLHQAGYGAGQDPTVQ